METIQISIPKKRKKYNKKRKKTSKRTENKKIKE